jgi:hypothetical protein
MEANNGLLPPSRAVTPRLPRPPIRARSKSADGCCQTGAIWLITSISSLTSEPALPQDANLRASGSGWKPVIDSWNWPTLWRTSAGTIWRR